MKKYGFGVDVGGTTCKIGLFDNTGVILDKWEIKTNTENNGASILDDIVASLEGKMAESVKMTWKALESVFRDLLKMTASCASV